MILINIVVSNLINRGQNTGLVRVLYVPSNYTSRVFRAFVSYVTN